MIKSLRLEMKSLKGSESRILNELGYMHRMLLRILLPILMPILMIVLCLLSSLDALADPAVRAAVIYDRPSKFDQSFSQAVYVNGVVKLRQDGLRVKEFEPARATQIEQAMIKLARRGYQPIIGQIPEPMACLVEFASFPGWPVWWLNLCAGRLPAG